MATMSISLPDALREFVEREVQASGYRTTSEYFRDIVQERQKRRAEERLESLIVEGLQSGPPIEATSEMWESLGKRVAERQSARQSKRLPFFLRHLQTEKSKLCI